MLDLATTYCKNDNISELLNQYYKSIWLYFIFTILSVQIIYAHFLTFILHYITIGKYFMIMKEITVVKISLGICNIIIRRKLFWE